MPVTLTYTLPATAAATIPAPASQIDRFYGRDLWFDVARAQGADYEVTAAGDWLLATGREALRQSIIRRIITDPGEWATLPDYGVGARMFVKARNTRAMRDELSERIKSQLLRDPRIEAVNQVILEVLADSLRIAVLVQPKGRALANDVVRAAVEVT